MVKRTWDWLADAMECGMHEAETNQSLEKAGLLLTLRLASQGPCEEPCGCDRECPQGMNALPVHEGVRATQRLLSTQQGLNITTNIATAAGTQC